jgi:hypothetical protein
MRPAIGSPCQKHKICMEPLPARDKNSERPPFFASFHQAHSKRICRASQNSELGKVAYGNGGVPVGTTSFRAIVLTHIFCAGPHTMAKDKRGRKASGTDKALNRTPDARMREASPQHPRRPGRREPIPNSPSGPGLKGAWRSRPMWKLPEWSVCGSASVPRSTSGTRSGDTSSLAVPSLGVMSPAWLQI